MKHDPPRAIEYESRLRIRRRKLEIAFVVGLVLLLCVACLLLRFVATLFGPVELSK